MDSEGLTGRTVAVLGLGLMGGSLAMALRGRVRRLIAVDPDPDTRRRAEAHGVVDAIAAEPGGLIREADLVVLAAPVRACLDLLGRLPDLHPGAAVVMDFASTKAEIARAYGRLPARFDPLPAHPMCGKETGGLENAAANLFAGAAFAITPLERTSPAALALGEEIATVLGAVPVRLDPATHDEWTARTSHAPYLLAAALAAALPAAARPLIGPGFRSTARLAGSDPRMMADILLTNREPVLAALEEIEAELGALKRQVAGGDPSGLAGALAAVREKYARAMEPAGGGR